MRFWNILEFFLLGGITATTALPRAGDQGTFRALYDFASQTIGETTLHKGELVTVIRQDASGWWLVQRLDGSSEGWTPGSYLSKVDSSVPSSTKKALPSITSTLRSKTSRATSTASAQISRTTFSEGITHASTSKRSSSTTKQSTSVRHSLSTSAPASSAKLTSPFSTESNNLLLPVSTSQAPAISSSSFRVYSSNQGTSSRSSIVANATSTSSTYSFLSKSFKTSTPSSKTVISTSRIFSITVSSTSSISNSMNMADAAQSLRIITSSSPASTSRNMVPASSNNATNCLLNCDKTNNIPTSTSSQLGCLTDCNSTKVSLTSATGEAYPRNSSTAAVPPECADPGGVNGITTACWNALDMNQYIDQWMLSHQGVCSAQTSFAQCFLQVLDIGMNDCVSISSGTCPPPSWLQFKDHHDSVRDFYAAYNIYAVWTFFNSYYSAIGNARSAATDSVAAIVSLLDPPKTNDAELSNINFALAIGLTFVKIEGFVNPAVESLVGFVANAARQAPQVARYLFPGPPGDTKFTQLGQISNQMGTLTDNLQKNVAVALAAIQNDTNTFLSFTGTGAFSNNPIVKIDQQSNNLLTALNTYVISLCLQANNWQISRAIDTDVNQLMANGTHLTWNITDCGTGYDSNSICGGYYWNKTIDVSYTLTNTDDMFANPQPIMQQFFANWTTPQLLFDGALQCQMAKGTGNPNISPVAGATDVTSTPCLSSVKICTWDLNPSHFGTQYEYTDCDVQSHFATQGCTQCDATTDFCTNVPSTYMGGYLLNPLADGPQYVYCNDGHSLIDAN